jgi:hypothetical protein
VRDQNTRREGQIVGIDQRQDCIIKRYKILCEEERKRNTTAGEQVPLYIHLLLPAKITKHKTLKP